MVTRIGFPGAVPDDEPNQVAEPAVHRSPELDALGLEASALEAGSIPTAAQAAPSNSGAELTEALQLVRALARPAFADWPEYEREVWTDSALSKIGTAGGAIMDRHGWTMGELFATWGPYIALVGATAPPALMTWQHLRIRKAQAEQAARRAPPGAVVQPPMAAPA